MNNLLIPSILAATILVAGMFAFMPIEKATTVHTTIQNTVQNTATLTDADWDAADAADDEKRLTCTAAAIIQEITFEIDGTLAGGDNINLVVDPDSAATATFGATTQVDIFGGAAPADEAALLSARGLQQGAPVIATGTVSLLLTAEVADDNNEALDLVAYYTSTGTCTWTSN